MNKTKLGHGGWPIEEKEEKRKEAMAKLAQKWWPKKLMGSDQIHGKN